MDYARKEKPGKSLPSRMIESVAKHPALALGIIVILLLVILYTFAKNRGWIGGGKSVKRPMVGKKAVAAKNEDDDPETEELIDSINSSAK